jgi:hypothetical protein
MSIRGGASVRPYLLTCGLLTIPILAWNLAFTRYLPPIIGNGINFSCVSRPLQTHRVNLRISPSWGRF